MSYNTRMLENWHRNTGLGDLEHPLLRPGSECHEFVYLTADQTAAPHDDHLA